MGKTERPPEDVTDPMMDRHADDPEGRTGEVRAVQASLRASRSAGRSTEAGMPRASAPIPSSAINDVMGLASFAYRASTQCAIAFSPLGPVTNAGSEIVSAGSYSTVRGRTRMSFAVRFCPSEVMP